MKYPALSGYLYDSRGIPYDAADKKLRALLVGSKREMEEVIRSVGPVSDSRDQKAIMDAFGYKRFADRNWAYDLLEIIDARVCPYCNHQYTFTIRGKIRPQFDHYYPKSIYPYLSISLFNLIPSCSTCNQAKSTFDTHQANFIYPYEDDFGTDAYFSTDFCLDDYESGFDFLIGKGTNFKLDIKHPEDRPDIENSISQLKLKEIYAEHKAYISNVFRSCYVMNNTFVDNLLRSFPQLFSSKEDVMGLMLSTELQYINWGHKPLAKLTADIYREIRTYTDR